MISSRPMRATHKDITLEGDYKDEWAEDEGRKGEVMKEGRSRPERTLFPIEI